MISTVNIQHLESMNDVVEQITGIKQRETIPDAVVRAADQIELVDMTPEALRRRMAHGNIYPPEKVDAVARQLLPRGQPRRAAASSRSCGSPTGSTRRSRQYREAHGIAATVGDARAGRRRDHRRARRRRRDPARRAHGRARTRGELLGVHVRSADGLRGRAGETPRRATRAAPGARRRVPRDRERRRRPTTLVQFARAENATQIVLGASRQSRWTHLLRGSVITNVLRASGDIDVHVISSDPTRQAPSAERAEVAARVGRAESALSPRRRIARRGRSRSSPRRCSRSCWRTCATTLTLPSDLLMFLLLVVVVAALGGFVPAFVSAITGFLLANWFFTPPFYTFTISQGENLVALVDLPAWSAGS